MIYFCGILKENLCRKVNLLLHNFYRCHSNDTGITSTLAPGNNDILICDTTKLNNVADYFILATGDSPAHLNGISDYVMSKTQENQDYYEFGSKEGFILSQWIVLDFDRVLVHLFVKEEREKYSLAKLLNEGRNQISYKKLQN